MMRSILYLVLTLLVACGDKQATQTEAIENSINQAPPAERQSPVPDNAIPPKESATTPPTAAADDGTVPIALQGRWTGAGDNCADKTAELELSITPDSLIFHESVGAVQRVKPSENGRFAVKADFTGEGDSWTRTLTLHPSVDGQRLTVTNDGTTVTRKRCAAA